MTTPTKILSSPEFPVTTFAEVLKGAKGSAAGYSAISTWLTCPERSRLLAKGVRQRSMTEGTGSGEKLTDLAFGTLAHYLRALRIVYGHTAVEEALVAWRPEIPEKSWLKAKLMFRTYETVFPRADESFQVLGTECEVISEIGKVNGKPILRTVRYDTVVKLPDSTGAFANEVFSFECKTMARSGQSSLLPYTPQAMCQVALWNANPDLVAQHGPMVGVLWDCLVKTESPTIERVGPHYFSRRHQALALEYLRAADDGSVQYRVQTDADGRTHYPRALHSCWGRWSPCPFIPLCHDGSFGDYEQPDATDTAMVVYDGT